MPSFPKPEPRARTKRRKLRVESLVKQKIRALVAERDGDCRLQGFGVFGECRGESEWAHLGDKKRARTRGMKPEDRHTREKSMMLCSRHHRLYDSGQLQIVLLDARGADGWLDIYVPSQISLRLAPKEFIGCES